MAHLSPMSTVVAGHVLVNLILFLAAHFRPPFLIVSHSRLVTLPCWWAAIWFQCSQPQAGHWPNLLSRAAVS